MVAVIVWLTLICFVVLHTLLFFKLQDQLESLSCYPICNIYIYFVTVSIWVSDWCCLKFQLINFVLIYFLDQFRKNRDVVRPCFQVSEIHLQYILILRCRNHVLALFSVFIVLCHNEHSESSWLKLDPWICLKGFWQLVLTCSNVSPVMVGIDLWLIELLSSWDCFAFFACFLNRWKNAKWNAV